jgi:hypothetical protein
MNWNKLIVAMTMGIAAPVLAGASEAHALIVKSPPMAWGDAPAVAVIGQHLRRHAPFLEPFSSLPAVVWRNDITQECHIDLLTENAFLLNLGLEDNALITTRGGNDPVAMAGGLFETTTFCGFEIAPLNYNGHFLDIFTAGGNDVIESGRGDTFCMGDSGTDKLESFTPIGRMIGGLGNDFIGGISAVATDWLQGDDDNDCLHDSGNNFAVFDCGPGTDLFWIANTPPNQTCETPRSIRCFPPGG